MTISGQVYSFTNGCAASDHFQTDTLGFDTKVESADNPGTFSGNCWDYRQSPSGDYSRYFSVTGGTLVYDQTGAEDLDDANGQTIYKQTAERDFQATVEISELTNATSDNKALLFQYGTVGVSLYGDPGTRMCQLNVDGAWSYASCPDLPTPAVPLYLRLTHSNGILTASFRYGSAGSFTDVGSEAYDAPESNEPTLIFASGQNTRIVINSFDIDVETSISLDVVTMVLQYVPVQ
jgi:hypothetical protein